MYFSICNFVYDICYERVWKNIITPNICDTSIFYNYHIHHLCEYVVYSFNIEQIIHVNQTLLQEWHHHHGHDHPQQGNAAHHKLCNPA